MLTDGSTSYIYGPDGLPVEPDQLRRHPHLPPPGPARLHPAARQPDRHRHRHLHLRRLRQHHQPHRHRHHPLLYAGQYQDAETGFYYLQQPLLRPRHRPVPHRRPRSSARPRAPYTYASDNPLNGTDPTGLGSQLVGQSCNPEDQYCAQDARYPCQQGGIGCRRAAPVSQIAGAVVKSGAAVAAYSFGLEGLAAGYGAAYALSVRLSAWLATLGAGSAATVSTADNSSEAAGGTSSVSDNTSAWLDRAREAAKQVEARQGFDETTYNAGHAGENISETIENAQKGLERVEPTGTMTRVPLGGPSYTEAGSYASSLSDPMTQMFVNGAIASRVVWLLLRRIFGGGG